jgi:hypothetical protein
MTEDATNKPSKRVQWDLPLLKEGGTTTTKSSSAFDFDHVQSLICGACDPFVALKEDPPSPVGFVQEHGAELFLPFTPAEESSVATLLQSFESGAKANLYYEGATYASIQADSTYLGSFFKDMGGTPGQRIGLSGKDALLEYLTAIQEACYSACATTVRSCIF